MPRKRCSCALVGPLWRGFYRYGFRVPFTRYDYALVGSPGSWFIFVRVLYTTFHLARLTMKYAFEGLIAERP